MKRITLDLISEFIANNNIPYTATQPKLCIPIVERLYNKMLHGILFEDIKICDNVIIDGHHRYLSSLMAGFKIGQVNSQKPSVTKSIEWIDIIFDENDWDTAAKISHLIEQDALYNDLDIEFIKQITFRNE